MNTPSAKQETPVSAEQPKVESQEAPKTKKAVAAEQPKAESQEAPKAKKGRQRKATQKSANTPSAKRDISIEQSVDQGDGMMEKDI